jgi:hypothetical protein
VFHFFHNSSLNIFHSDKHLAAYNRDRAEMRVELHVKFVDRFVIKIGTDGFIFIIRIVRKEWSPTGSTRHVGHQLAYCTYPG